MYSDPLSVRLVMTHQISSDKLKTSYLIPKVNRKHNYSRSQNTIILKKRKGKPKSKKGTTFQFTSLSPIISKNDFQSLIKIKCYHTWNQAGISKIPNPMKQSI